MKHIMRLVVMLAMVAPLLGSCHNKTVPVINSRTEFPPAPRSSTRPLAENSPEAIAAGKTIFETRCNRCHDLKIVDAYTTERWSSILPTMIPRARLNDEQAKELRSYVMAGARK
jgi:mono/diheme cytochrome c family protein